MRERDTAWLELEGKPRPAVVIEVVPDLVRVAYGSSQEHRWPCAIVHKDTRQGKAFPLHDETTHFYGANTTWTRASELQPGERQVAFELLFAIRKLVEDYDAGLAPDR